MADQGMCVAPSGAHEDDLRALDALPYYATLVTADHHIIWCNRAFAAAMGASRRSCHGAYCPKLAHQSDGPIPGCPVEVAVETGAAAEVELYDEQLDAWFRSTAYPTSIRSEDGQVVYLHMARDVTEFKRTQDKNARLQRERSDLLRIKAAGTLSASIVHDLNNLLTVIQMDAEVAASTEATSADRTDCLEEIQDVARRCTALTRRFLLLSRAQDPATESMQVNEIIEGSAELVRSILGNEVELRLDLAPDLPWVDLDSSGLEQVLVNLAMNARDALDGPGVVEVTTGCRELEADGDLGGRILPGTYVVIGFADSGHGILQEVVGKVFDAFFTTKGIGEGTGLGLKVVHDFAVAAGGAVSVNTETDHGTRFDLYLPPAQESDTPLAVAESIPRVPLGERMVCAFTDQGDLARAMDRALRAAGCEYHSAPMGQEGVLSTARHHRAIDLALVDLHSQQAGLATARALLATRHDLQVLFLTDPTTKITELEDFYGDRIATLLKPFSRAELIESIRETLDR